MRIVFSPSPRDLWRVRLTQHRHQSLRLHVDMGFNATCLLKLCLSVSWWVLPRLNYSGAELCTTKCYLSVGLELAVFKTGTFSLLKLVLLQRGVVAPACCPALPCYTPPLKNGIQDLLQRRRQSWDTHFAIKS